LLGAFTVGALRPADVHRLIRKSLDGGASPSTVGRIVTTLRMALGQAVRDGELTVNVAQVRLPRVHRETIEAMTATRAQAILEAVKDDDLEALYVLLLGTGMRLGEACALDWRDVVIDSQKHSDSGSVFIRHGKTRAATRTIPLAPYVVRALLVQRAKSPRVGPSEPVFLGPRTSERLTTGTASHALPRLMEAAGLPRITPHKLRHGTATLLLAKGMAMRDIADILGHSNPSVTANVYAHTVQESRDRAATLLEEAMG
jgi:integrase